MNFFNDSITMRLNTLERNIKSKSNSFYDSYLDLLESTIKYFLDENKVNYDETRTCGYIIKDKKPKEFFYKKMNIDDYTYNKLIDYIKKCNDHKHKKEKTLGIESVINYLKVYYDFINYYISYKNGVNIKFDAKYYESIFGETERINAEYKEKVTSLKEELSVVYKENKLSKQDVKKYKELVEMKDIELMSLEEQNDMLKNQIMILQDIKINSLEGKMYTIADNLHELVDTFNDNKVVKGIIKAENLDFGKYDHNATIKDINNQVAKTKKVIDKTNDVIKKGKEEFAKVNDGIDFLIDIINEIKK